SFTPTGGVSPPLASVNGKSAEVAQRPAVAEAMGQSLELVHVLLREVDAEVVQDGRRQVGRADGPVADVAAVARCRTVDLSAADSSTREQGREGVRPTIAPSLLRVVALREPSHLRRLSELAERD